MFEELQEEMAFPVLLEILERELVAFEEEIHLLDMKKASPSPPHS